MNYRTFLTFDIIGGLLWGVGVTTLGYFLGQISFVKNNIEFILLGVVFVSVVPVLLRAEQGTSGRRRRRRCRSRSSRRSTSTATRSKPTRDALNRQAPAGGDGSFASAAVRRTNRPTRLPCTGAPFPDHADRRRHSRLVPGQADAVSLKTTRFVASFEGFLSCPYADPAGHATIGYGHLLHYGPPTRKDRKKWGCIGKARGLKMLRSDLDRAEAPAARPDQGSHGHAIDGHRADLFRLQSRPGRHRVSAGQGQRAAIRTSPGRFETGITTTPPATDAAVRRDHRQRQAVRTRRACRSDAARSST